MIVQSEIGYGYGYGYVQTAQRRLEEMRKTEVSPLDPPTIPELEEALGEEVQKCEMLGENWRNRVYRVSLVGGRIVVAKQRINGTDETLQYQWAQLQIMAKLEILQLHVPKPLALLRAKRVCVMEFASGKPIPALAWDRAHAAELVPACRLAGEILAELHTVWTQKIGPAPVDLLAADLVTAPWRLSSLETKALQSALERLAGAEVSMGKVYCDYNAANLLFENGEITLVDPPDRLREGVQLWDFACFRSSMRRHLQSFSLQRPFDRRRAIIRKSLVAFERGYLAKVDQRYTESYFFPVTVRLLELQRTAVLLTMQKGKVDLMRQDSPIAADGSLGNPIWNRLTLALLEIERRWLFRQLARELSG